MPARSLQDGLRLVLALTLVGLAFGYIEGAVVVYLRAIAYPGGFHFPLEPISELLLRTELIREAATLLLLLGIALVAARDGLRRFAAFTFCFGVWDLAYYATLKLVLGWPAGWLDWDILFLIPLPWTAPVLAPVLVSLLLVGASAHVLLLGEASAFRPRLGDWLVEILAAGILLASFLWNGSAMLREESPERYPWWLFALGWLLALGWFLRVALRHSRGVLR